jgi:hypothetical protein
MAYSHQVAESRAIIFPDALMSGDDCAWLKRLHFIEGSNPLLALLLIGRLWCAVKALVHSGGIPARELVRSTR